MAALQNLGLIFLFAAQHSLMARPWWKNLIPVKLQRPLYVAATLAALLLMYYLWQPIPGNVWNIETTAINIAVRACGWTGWIITIISAASMYPAELLGLRHSQQPFQITAPYKLVRHPMMLGLLIAFWSTPTMSNGRLVFAAAFTAYILIAIRWEEKDLRTRHGEEYANYAKRVPMLIPWR